MQLVLKLEPGSTEPLYEQIAEAIRKAIDEGVILPGQALPSSRELAESLAISRITVRRSYESLASQGLIKSFNRGKTIVNRTFTAKANTAPAQISFAPVQLSNLGNRIAELSLHSAEFYDNRYCGAPPVESLPVSRWRDCLYTTIRDTSGELLKYENDPFGAVSLREEIRKFVLRTRAIACTTDQIVVFPSTEGGIDLTLRTLLNEGDGVLVEDPGFAGLQRNLSVQNLKAVPLPVDSNGLRTDLLETLHENPTLAYVTPARHDPTGVSMSGDRRVNLLNWASNNDVIVLEDDFDSEFRYGVQSQPALFSLDKHDLVVYRYNFWKALYPLVKISFMILPLRLVPIFQRSQSLFNRDTPLLEQIALGTFIRNGCFERHLRSCHGIYKRNRAFLIHELTKAFGPLMTINRAVSGTSQLIRFHPKYTEAAMISAAQQAGIPLRSTEPNYYQAIRPSNEFVVSYDTIDEASISEQIKLFAQLCEA